MKTPTDRATRRGIRLRYSPGSPGVIHRPRWNKTCPGENQPMGMEEDVGGRRKRRKKNRKKKKKVPHDWANLSRGEFVLSTLGEKNIEFLRLFIRIGRELCARAGHPRDAWGGCRDRSRKGTPRKSEEEAEKNVYEEKSEKREERPSQR